MYNRYNLIQKNTIRGRERGTQTEQYEPSALHPDKKPTEEMFRKENEYYKPELELYETPIEIGFSASDPEADNDFEYGDGDDAW